MKANNHKHMSHARNKPLMFGLTIFIHNMLIQVLLIYTRTYSREYNYHALQWNITNECTVTYVMITWNGIYTCYKCEHNFNIISVLITPDRKWVITIKLKTLYYYNYHN